MRVCVTPSWQFAPLHAELTRTIRSCHSTMEISNHGLSRYMERFGGDENQMREQLSRAVPFGCQLGEDHLLIDGEAVFVITKDNVVKTCLHRNMVIVNMQSRIRGFRYDEPLVPKVKPPKGEAASRKSAKPEKPSIPEETRDLINRLAESHCNKCFPSCFSKGVRKIHNASLREHGIDPSSDLGAYYREQFMQIYTEKRLARSDIKSDSGNV